jgi:uroporphyrin-III C-methyltransferase/precorrin-2 dehydrogenase/sirohydrochlorin ferrochelatase
LVLLMGMDTLDGIAADLIKHGRPADTPAVAIHKATLPGQRIVRSSLAGLSDAVREADLGAPSVVVIGAVAGLGLTLSS